MKLSFSGSSASLVALACALGAPGVVCADEAERVEDTIVVTAQKLQERDLQTLSTPALGVGVSADQIDAINALNVEDSLRYAPNMIVRKRFIGDANATLILRGGHSQQTPWALVQVDGFTISNFLGASWDTAPKWALTAPGDVERVEVVYGPTSARYSGNTIGGALLLETREIEENRAFMSAQLIEGEYDYYQTDHALDGWAVDGGFDARLNDRAAVSFSYRHFQNEGQPQMWRTISGSSEYADQAVRDNTLGFLRIAAEDSVVATEEDQFRMRGEYDFGGSWEGRALIGVLKDTNNYLNPQTFIVDAEGEPTFQDISGVSARSSETTERLIGLGLRGEAAGWKLDFALSRFDVLKGQSSRSDNFSQASNWLTPLDGTITFTDGTAWTTFDASAEQSFGTHSIATGLSYQDYRFKSRRHDSADWHAGRIGELLDGSGGNTQLLGVFVEDAIAFTDKWIATLGLRAETWEASDGLLINGSQLVAYQDRTENALSPKAALSFAPDGNWEFVASVAQATRFPTVQELYQAGLIAYGADAGDLDLNGFDPDLKPEEALDYQLTASRAFSNAVVTVSAFRQEISDVIFSQRIPLPVNPNDPDSAITQSSLRTNFGELVTNGLDLIVAAEDLLIDGLDIDANISLLDSEITENPLNPEFEGNVWPRVPDVRANASVRYSPTEDWLFAAGWRYQDTPYRDLANNPNNSQCSTYFCASGFSFVDLKATRHFDQFKVSLGVDNVFDERAFVFHPYPGRTFVLEAKWTGGF